MWNKQYIHTKEDARAIDAQAQEKYHIPSLLLMEHAAIECTNILIREIDKKQRICILCGPGNNGADGLAIARLLNEKGYSVFASLPLDHSYSQEAKIQRNMIEALSIESTSDLPTILHKIKTCDILIDALFGNGLSRDIQEPYATIIQAVNASNAFVYAIDIPSGIDANNGTILGHAIQANKTIVIDCLKEGQCIYPGNAYCAQQTIIPIGIPEHLHQQFPHSIWIDENLAASFLPKRNNFSHKGSFSKALMIGGSLEMPGAITLASLAAEKSGIGTLTIMEPNCIGDLLFAKMNFAMHLRCKDTQGHFAMQAVDTLIENIQNYDIVSIGNGMKRTNETIQLVQTTLDKGKTVLLDADALWAMQKQCNLLKRENLTILTPHLKEMTYLTDWTLEEIQKNPFTCVRQFVNKYPNCILVLKSDTTYIASRNETFVLSNPNSALAKGGSGDILCGLITGLIGHKTKPIEAICSAVYIHSAMAQMNKDAACIMPDDCINNLENVFITLRKKAE